MNLFPCMTMPMSNYNGIKLLEQIFVQYILWTYHIELYAFRFQCACKLNGKALNSCDRLGEKTAINVYRCSS